MKNNSKLRPWIVIFSASLFFFYEFIQMNMFNAISENLIEEFDLSAINLGYLSSTYFWATVIFLFPAGIILDRFSVRKILLTAVSLCIVGTFFIGLSTSPLQIAIFRFLTGIGSAFCFLSCVKIASRWFSSHRLAFVIGLVVTMAMIGGLIAQTPFTLLTLKLGWRHSIMIDAAFGLVILITIAIFVRDFPPHYTQKRLEERKQLESLSYWKIIRLGFLKLQNWLCGVYTCLMNLPINLLGGLWGILYLEHVHNIEKTSASLITSMLFLGTIVGSPLAGWISDHMRLRRLPMIIGAILSIATILIIMRIPHLSFYTLMLLFFILGIVTATQIISYPTVSESNTKILTATSVSVVSFVTLSGGVIFQPLFGRFMNSHWNGVLISNHPLYSTGDYQFAMWLFPVTLGVALVAALSVKETHGHRLET
jgi:MFS family permease